jgi:hypothetical protein
MKSDVFSQKLILKSSYENKLPIQILAAQKKGIRNPDWRHGENYGFISL